MKINPDDPRLTAYALGELDAADRQAIEAELEKADEFRQAVEEIVRTAALLNAELTPEPLPGLTHAQRLAIEAKLKPESGKAEPRKNFFVTTLLGGNPFRRIAVFAGGVAVGFLALIAASWFAAHLQKGPQRASAERAESDGDATSDAAFARWAAPYQRLQIPLVSVEEAGSYTPPEILPIRPAPAM
jgi:anti-sigma-K factor RskA